MVKSLADLIDIDEPAIEFIRKWIESTENDCVILPPSSERESIILEMQVTTHSTMGSVAYETGGILIDHGWLRFLGSGHFHLRRTLSGWNQGRSNGFYLIADDVVGGFFAINGGALGEERGNVYYLPPDSLEWESLKLGYTDFFQWALTDRLAEFYSELRWPKWMEDVAAIDGDQCFSFYPFLWASSGSVQGSHRRAVPTIESFDFKMDMLLQL